VFPDPEQKMNGRGAYLCRKPECIARASAQNLLAVHLKTEVQKIIYQQLAAYLPKNDKPEEVKLLGFAARAGKLVYGMTSVEQGVRKGQIELIVIDSDLQNHSRKRLRIISEKNHVKMIVLNNEISLTPLIGKNNCKCVGVRDKHFASEIKKRIN